MEKLKTSTELPTKLLEIGTHYTIAEEFFLSGPQGRVVKEGDILVYLGFGKDNHHHFQTFLPLGHVFNFVIPEENLPESITIE